MREIALHVLDIVQNSLAAGAKLICVSLEVRPEDNLLSLVIEDDGAGMDEAALAKACDPFYTSRAGKSVGLGLSLFRASAEGAGGSFSIESKRGKGTRVAASYALDHIDRPPLGDLADVLSAQIAVNPNVEFRLVLSSGEKERVSDTRTIKWTWGEDSLASPRMQEVLKRTMQENSVSVYGGKL